MSRANPIRNLKTGGVVFFCPGCNDTHSLNTSRTGPQWAYNGDPARPTFSPSILYTAGHYCPGEDGKDCWCNFEERYPEYKGKEHPKCYRCHSFVMDGRIQFLGDCTHALADQTVRLPPWPHDPGTFGGLEDPGLVLA